MLRRFWVLWAAGLALTEMVHADPPTFSWAPGSVVKVTEICRKTGSDMMVSYKLHVEEKPNGHLLVSPSDIEPLQINGLVRPKDAPLGSTTQLSLRAGGYEAQYDVSPEGQLVDVPNFDGMVDAMQELFKEQRWESPEAKNSALAAVAQMKSSSGRQLLRGLIVQKWASWVQTWRSFKVAPGETSTAAEKTAVPFGKAVDVQVKRWNLGPVPSDPKLSHLKCEITTSDPSLRDRLLQYMEKVRPIKSEEDKRSREKLAQSKISTVVTTECYIDLATLRPNWVKRTSVSVIDPMPADIHSGANRLEFEYSFDWPKESQ